jgi:hypothetical protein
MEMIRAFSNSVRALIDDSSVFAGKVPITFDADVSTIVKANLNLPHSNANLYHFGVV